MSAKNLKNLNSLIRDELTLRKLKDIEFKVTVDLMDSDGSPNAQVKAMAITKKINELEGDGI
ncbi:hypothetical protein HNW13_018125 [Shewanella sp. BF02_Schw]|uniref:hypothetical protein n=1 Tax=Shewanella sp. BF02_Schw TaxID=394908 RepID=UPI0017839A3B|nr:hypothetical protein [Shewanella sp. BF02_Schw]MBO1897658.1 hypothetical protein [Shewanella sp. BF02_Schw]